MVGPLGCGWGGTCEAEAAEAARLESLKTAAPLRRLGFGSWPTLNILINNSK
jgi:hypothetical protein